MIPEVVARSTYTVSEVAILLGISRSSAFDGVHRNEIPSIKIGKRILCPKLAIDRLLKQGQVNGDAE